MRVWSYSRYGASFARAAYSLREVDNFFVMSDIKNKNERGENVVEAISKTQNFFDKNKKRIIYGMGAIIVIAAAVVLYHRFVQIPARNEAVSQTFPAEQSFRAENWEVALNGDGNNLGFKQLIEEYGTAGGEALYFYAGACEMHLGNFESAISYFEKYNGKDPIIAARATCCIGDAYSNLEQLDKAASYYEKAAAQADNMLAANYLFKAATVYEAQGKSAEALKNYKFIKEKYPQSPEAYEIEKYISRLENTK